MYLIIYARYSERSIFKFNLPKTKLSGLKICPNGPDRTESIVPGSKSTNTALGTYLPPEKESEDV